MSTGKKNYIFQFRKYFLIFLCLTQLLEARIKEKYKIKFTRSSNNFKTQKQPRCLELGKN